MWLKYDGKYINLDNVVEIHTVDFESTVIDDVFSVIFSFNGEDGTTLNFKSLAGRDDFMGKLSNQLMPFQPIIREEIGEEAWEAIYGDE